MEYVILMEFIKWCEDNEDTEWMGYYRTAEDRVGRFLEWRHSKTENE